ncbi:DUF397 domain-containing protein [Actinomadura rugatobispora]|uniref:DUF397 domain-containing protein n=1 Tax=Actinomadura rugatobispora TaxID=1994 RepID=A0ABW0ZUW1_9ACTN|nr:hypothetical protein GCM10010200_056560 [Actinomadura rugatobispora]
MDLSNVVWRRAARSKEDGSNCVEVASSPGGVMIRDSKDPDGPWLVVVRGDFRRFAECIKGVP